MTPTPDIQMSPDPSDDPSIKPSESFFATLDKSQLYLVNEAEKLIYSKPFKALTEIPPNHRGWQTIIGIQIDRKKFGDYTTVDTLPFKKESEPPSKVPQKVSPAEPNSETQQLPESTLPDNFAWWFAGDEASVRHVVEPGKARPMCKPRHWKHPNKWSDTIQGCAPCPDCVKALADYKPPASRSPWHDLTDGWWEETPEDIRPSKPNYGISDRPARLLWDAGFTKERVAAFVKAKYPTYRQWMKEDSTRPIMSMAYVERNIRAWEATPRKADQPQQAAKKKDWGVEA